MRAEINEVFGLIPKVLVLTDGMCFAGSISLDGGEDQFGDPCKKMVGKVYEACVCRVVTK